MITFTVPNTRDYQTTNGNCIKIVGPTLPDVDPPAINDICICDYIICEYYELVFGSPSNDEWKKDYSDFLFRRLVAADTVELELHNLKEKVADLDDNTLGTLFDGFTQGNNDQSLYYGFLLDWSAVLSAHGADTYFVKAKLDILGVETEVDSRYFKLYQYSDLIADKTVRIHSVQNGNLFGTQFDFTGLEWNQYLRVAGKFGNPTPQYETDRYIDSEQNYRQIKDQMTRRWSLNTGLIPWEVAEKLVYNKMMANELYMTDYDIYAESIWRNISVRLEDLDKPEIFNFPRKRYNFTFVDNQLVFQKRNF